MDTPHALSNIFSQSPTLDSETIHDLLNCYIIGTERMIQYVNTYILAPPDKIPKKKHRLAKLYAHSPINRKYQGKAKLRSSK